MATFEQEFIEKKIDIKIPLLQRDYVQGGREDVIRPFLEQLNSAVRNKTEKIDLNYIYGYEDDDSTAFIPIDGQQRLITLWLLHLYIYAKTLKEYPVNLIFESREFADSFCEQLKENLLKGNLRDFINENGDRGVCLKEKIIDANWFVNGWLLDVTVVNMLNTFNLIDEYESKEKLPDNPFFENIVFEFLNIKGRNIDDDVYIKMNGRGRPLSYFENLKSWMDEQVKKEEDFGKEWENKMDNEWTDFFWKNRNQNQQNPEEIDDEQVRLFYSLLLLYWRKNVSNDKDDDLFSSLQSGRMISLYQIETSKLFDSEVFHFISESLDVLCEISDYINNNIQNIVGVLDSDKTTTLYKLVLKDATYSSSLPLLYAMIKTPKLYRSSSLFRWMRIWINLVHNSDIRQENLGRFCETVDKICEEVENGNSSDTEVLYRVLSNFHWEEGMGIAKVQFHEEIEKAKQIIDEKEEIRKYKRKDGSPYDTWEEIIIDAESYAFFKGAIRFLFQNKNGEPCWDDFDKKWENAKTYFKEEPKDFNLLKKLISCVSEFIDMKKIYYDNYHWRNGVLLNSSLYECVNNFLLGNLNKEHTGWTDAQKFVFNDLVEKDILEGILPNCQLEEYGRGYRLWIKGIGNGQQWKKYLIGCVRNEILSELYGGKICESNKDESKIYTGQKNDKGSFFWGEHVDFKYKEYFFQWYGNPNEKELDVYLMDNDWADYKKRQEPVNDEQTDRRDFYCFSVTAEMNNDTSLFIDELDKLIEQVKE